MKIRKRKALDRVILLEFRSQYDLASTFLRFQEHYESPHFRNKVFSLEEYMDWYARTRGNFTYYQDWAGFNVPSRVLAPFRSGKFDPLLEKERTLLRLLSSEPEPFYVIGVNRADPFDRMNLEHELAHGLFTTNQAYQREVLAALREYDTTAVKTDLRREGYHPSVITDEVHAYVMTANSTSSPTLRRLARLRKRLRRIFQDHGGAAAVKRLTHGH